MANKYGPQNEDLENFNTIWLGSIAISTKHLSVLTFNFLQRLKFTILFHQLAYLDEQTKHALRKVSDKSLITTDRQAY